MIILLSFASVDSTAQVVATPGVGIKYDGRLEVFYPLNGSIAHSWQQGAAVEQNWALNASLGGAMLGSASVVSNSDGRLEVFIEGTDRNIYHNWQVTPGGGWSGWYGLGIGPLAGPPTVVDTTDGALEVFVVINNVVYFAEQSAPESSSTWTGWIAIGGASIATTPSVIKDYQGNIHIFAQGTDGAAWTNTFSISTDSWGGWSSLGGIIFGSPTAALNLDGRLEIFALGGYGGLNFPYHNWEVTPGGSWSGWNWLGGAIQAAPSIALNYDGRIEVFGVGGDNSAYHNWQTTPGGGWSGWSSLGGGLSSGISAFRNADGRVEIFTQVSNGVVYQNYQLTAGGGWSGWYPIDGASTPVASGTAGYLGFGTLGGPLSGAEDSAVSNFWRSKPWTGTVTPTQVGIVGFPTWECSNVAVSFVGFPSGFWHNLNKRAQRAVDNWNQQLATVGSHVHFTRDVGDGIHSMTIRYTTPTADPGPTTVDAFTQGYTHLGTAVQVDGGHIGHVNIDINSHITAGGTITQVVAHEIGHTFQLAHCPQTCPLNAPCPPCPFDSVMASKQSPNISQPYYAACQNGQQQSPACALVAINFKQGTSMPSPSDMAAVTQANPQLIHCANQSSDQPPACIDGSSPNVSEGFASNGAAGEPVTTCDGTVCDACDLNCSSFRSAACGAGNPTQGSPPTGGSTCNGTQCGTVCIPNPAPFCATVPVDVPEYCCMVYGIAQPCCPETGSPILIDAANQGFHLTGLSDGVAFSRGPGTPPITISWTDPRFKNAWLALDRNGNGRIDDLTELFGNLTPQPPSNSPNGYNALAVFDDPKNGGNGNGKIDQGDAIYWQLRLWVDKNHDGISQPDELFSLPAVGILSIDLSYKKSDFVDQFGNAFRYVANVTDVQQNSDPRCYDVFLQMVPKGAFQAK